MFEMVEDEKKTHTHTQPIFDEILIQKTLNINRCYSLARRSALSSRIVCAWRADEKKREERTRPFILKVRVHQLSKAVLMSSLKTFNWTKTIIKINFEKEKKTHTQRKWTFSLLTLWGPWSALKISVFLDFLE